MPPPVSPNNVTLSDKEAPPRSAASPWAVIAAIVGAISAVLGLPKGSPPVLFQIFLMSICCAVLLFAVAVATEFFRSTTCVPHQQTTLNLPLCITFLENMACCFLLIAFFSAAFILQIGHASGARILVFFPTLLLFLLLLISFWYAYRIAIHIPAENHGNSTASDPHKDVPSDLENPTLP